MSMVDVPSVMILLGWVGPCSNGSSYPIVCLVCGNVFVHCITGCFLLNSFASRYGLSIRFVKRPEKYSVGGRSRKRFNSYKLGSPMNSLSTFLHRSCTTQKTKRCHTLPWAKIDREYPPNHDWTKKNPEKAFSSTKTSEKCRRSRPHSFCGKYCG